MRVPSTRVRYTPQRTCRAHAKIASPSHRRTAPQKGLRTTSARRRAPPELWANRPLASWEIRSAPHRQ
eukprot:12544729-Alexandrium_andersonii.AAC.1